MHRIHPALARARSSRISRIAGKSDGTPALYVMRAEIALGLGQYAEAFADARKGIRKGPARREQFHGARAEHAHRCGPGTDDARQGFCRRPARGRDPHQTLADYSFGLRGAGIVAPRRHTALARTNMADLVALSACETGLGKIASGGDVVGLTRGFLYAGARSVVASLWSVDDRATAGLMQSFYRNLAGMNKREALRQAQIAARASFPHPFFWAAFQLTGRSE